MKARIIFSLFLLNLVAHSAIAQNKVIYNLVLEGGGAKGMAYPGALMELDKLHVLDSIKAVAGTSSGSINAVFLAVGYTPSEMYHVSYNINYKRLKQKGFPIIQPIARMKSTFGWYSSKRLTDMIMDGIEHKTGNRNLTFAQLHDSAIKYPKYKDLFVTGTSLNEQRTIIFSYLTYPNMRVADAIRISSTLPFHYETIYMEPSGRIIHHKHQSDSTLLMVDGGLIMNYPIHVFDSLLDYGTCKEYLPNPHTLGLRLEEENQICIDQGLKRPSPLSIRGFDSYMAAFYELSFEKMNRMSLSAADLARTITIDSKDVSTRDTHLSKEQKEALVASGVDAVRAYYNLTTTSEK